MASSSASLVSASLVSLLRQNAGEAKNVLIAAMTDLLIEAGLTANEATVVAVKAFDEAFTAPAESLKRMMAISYQAQGGADMAAHCQSEVGAANKMYKFVNRTSGGFTCTPAYLFGLWEAARFTVFGYN
jgi:phenylpyruvate tautomerase PptA (4-oxalocrotonate tautomerase family)